MTKTRNQERIITPRMARRMRQHVQRSDKPVARRMKQYVKRERNDRRS